MVLGCRLPAWDNLLRRSCTSGILIFGNLHLRSVSPTFPLTGDLYFLIEDILAGLIQSIHVRMDVWKRGENPPLPRSREGNESRMSHCPETIGMGRLVSRAPEAGRPIHPKYLEGGTS